MSEKSTSDAAADRAGALVTSALMGVRLAEAMGDDMQRRAMFAKMGGGNGPKARTVGKMYAQVKALAAAKPAVPGNADHKAAQIIKGPKVNMKPLSKPATTDRNYNGKPNAFRGYYKNK